MSSKQDGSVPRRGTFGSWVVDRSRLRQETLGQKNRLKTSLSGPFRKQYGAGGMLGPHYAVIVGDRRKVDSARAILRPPEYGQANDLRGRRMAALPRGVGLSFGYNTSKILKNTLNLWSL